MARRQFDGATLIDQIADSDEWGVWDNSANGGLGGFRNATSSQIAAYVSQNYAYEYDITNPSYGAVGDGVTDDTAAIQACITAAQAAGEKAFAPTPQVAWLMSDTVSFDSVNNTGLLGSGRGCIFKLANNAMKTPFYIDVDSNGAMDDFEIGNFTIDGNRDNQTPLGSIVSATVANGGSGYSAGNTLTLVGGSSNATISVTATVNGTLSTVTLNSGGTGYTLNDVLTVSGGTATVAVSGVSGGVVTSVIIYQNYGSGYSTGTNVSTSGGTGTGCTIDITAVANGFVSGFTISNAGDGYDTGATTTTGGAGTGCTVSITGVDNTAGILYDREPETGLGSVNGIHVQNYTNTYDIRRWYVHDIHFKDVRNVGLFWNTSNTQEDNYGCVIERLSFDNCDVSMWLHEFIFGTIDKIHIDAPITYGIYLAGICTWGGLSNVHIDGRPDRVALAGIAGGNGNASLNNCYVAYCTIGYDLTTDEPYTLNLTDCFSFGNDKIGYRISPGGSGNHSVSLVNCFSASDGANGYFGGVGGHADADRVGFYLYGRGSIQMVACKVYPQGFTRYSVRHEPTTNNELTITSVACEFPLDDGFGEILGQVYTSGNYTYTARWVGMDDYDSALSIDRGGTGSTTQNFVDLTTDQTIEGRKYFVNASANETAQPLTIDTGDGSTKGLIVKAATLTEEADPSTITGLRNWYKANALALSDNDLVSTWDDESGNGYDATQSTVANKPTYKTNQINGLPAVMFSADTGVEHYLNLPSMSSLTAGEIFAVIKTNDDPASAPKGGLWSLSSGTTGPDGTWYPYSDGQIYESFGSTSRKTLGNPSDALTSWRAYNVRSGADGFAALIDGSVFYQTETNTVGFASAPKLGKSTASNALSGYIAEVIIFDRVLSTANRLKIHAYLSNKYDLTIENVMKTNQTANLQEWQDGDGNALGFVDKDGFVNTDRIQSVDGTSHIQLSAGTNKLVKSTVLRQDNTTNTYQVGNSVTLTGWGVFSTGAAANKSETVTFGVTFAQAPIVICTYGGDDTGGATTYGAGGNEDKGPVCMKAHSVTTTNFVAQAHTADATNWDANATVFYQWIAIGEIA